MKKTFRTYMSGTGHFHITEKCCCIGARSAYILWGAQLLGIGGAALHRRYDAVNVPIELLRTLVTIEELGSVSKAAEALSLTQPAISAQMRRLEKLVGDDVRFKGETGAQITPKGEMIVRYARRILALNDQILLHSRNKSMPKTCHVGVSIVYAGNALKDIISLLRDAKTPKGVGLDVDFIVSEPSELARELTAGYVDIAIMPAQMKTDMNPYAKWTERMVWLCSKNFLLSPGRPIPLVGWKSGISHRLMIEALDRSNVPYTIAFSADDWSSRLAAVRAGLGYIGSTARAFEPDLKIANEYYLPPLPDLPMGIFLAETADTERTAPILEMLARYFAAERVVRIPAMASPRTSSNRN